MLRLVFCDVDGTLLPRGETAVSEETLDVLRRLTDRGITVAIASGRPYPQLRALFGALSHRLVFICLDGALTRRHDFVLHKRPLPPKAVAQLLSEYPKATVHGREAAYSLGGAPVGRPIASPNEVGEPVLKLELFTDKVPEENPNYRLAYREPGIAELVAPCANKGNAALTLMDKLGITPEQAVAFGDSRNDKELLSVVGHPYRMRGTLPGVDATETDSVLHTLRTLFNL
ncbi:MAG: HAD family phosphatase [Clostridia bacterium]|nr:HAD family phosphatase [Clostridia bacterium]